MLIHTLTACSQQPHDLHWHRWHHCLCCLNGKSAVRLQIQGACWLTWDGRLSVRSS